MSSLHACLCGPRAGTAAWEPVGSVLGMLRVASLGHWIQDARTRQRYDEMPLPVALGGALVLVGDLASYAARRWLRGGS